MTARRDPEPGADRALAERPADLAVVVGSAAFVAAGLAWPQAADVLLRLLFASLAVGWITVRVYRSVQPMRDGEEQLSPFDDGLASAAPPAAPQALRKLAADLEAADRPRARRATIPASALRTIRTDAARRLAEHHGLRLSDPDHHDRIRSMISDPMWHVIRPEGTGPTSAPLSGLGRILDELERL